MGKWIWTFWKFKDWIHPEGRFVLTYIRSGYGISCQLSQATSTPQHMNTTPWAEVDNLTCAESLSILL